MDPSGNNKYTQRGLLGASPGGESVKKINKTMQYIIATTIPVMFLFFIAVSTS